MFPQPLLFRIKQRIPQDHSGVVIRPHERQQLKLAENGVVQELMTSKITACCSSCWCGSIPEDLPDPDPYTHKGADAGLILSGKLDLWVDGKHYSLVEGDSFQFSSELPHRYQNNSDVLTTAALDHQPRRFTDREPAPSRKQDQVRTNAHKQGSAGGQRTC
jgi:hypothetical protein